MEITNKIKDSLSQLTVIIQRGLFCLINLWNYTAMIMQEPQRSIKALDKLTEEQNEMEEK